MTNESKLPPKEPSPVPEALPKAYKAYYFLTLIASLIGAAMQIILYVTQYDTSIGMYARGSVLAGIFICYSVVVILAILSMPILFRMKTERKNLPDGGISCVFSSVLCAFILLAVLIMRFVYGQVTLGVRGAGAAAVLELFEMILILPSAAFFLLPVLTKSPSKTVETALAFSPVLWCLLYLMRIYFDRSTSLGSPARLLTILSLLASMLFFLLQLRIMVRKPKTSFLLTAVNAGTFLSAISAIPLISASFINRWGLTGDAMYSAVQVCFLTYFITRANSYFTENN